MPNNFNKKIAIIYNPAAGKREQWKFNEIVEKLKNNGHSLKVLRTEYPGHAKKLAAECGYSDYDLLVVAGGDGTINEVTNGLYPCKLSLGIIPMGTANVLAKEIGLSDDVQSIINYIQNGIAKDCWLGRVDDEYFTLMVSAGYDAISVRNVSKKLKRLIGKTAYAISFLSALISTQKIKYKVTYDNQELEASNVIISNGKFYGGKFLCAPDGNISERKLYLIIAKKFGRFAALKYAFLMFHQQYPFDKSVSIIPIDRAKIECDQNEIPIQIDGDFAGYLPKEVSISDSPITLLYPPK